MSSLAEQLRDRHRESSGELVETLSTPAFSAESSIEHTQEPSPAQPSPPSAPALNLSSLPQLGSAKAYAAPRKWGAFANTTESNGLAAPVNSTGPKISPRQPTSLTFTVETSEQRPVILQAVKRVMSSFNVRIEMANSGSPNHSTFMIKASSPSVSAEQLNAARHELEANLQPQDTIKVSVPSSARASLIGSRGANLKNLQSAHRVEIEVPKNDEDSSSSVDSLWSLNLTHIKITGCSAAVQAAREAVLANINGGTKPFSSTRQLSPQAAAYLALSDDWVRALDNDGSKITLRGRFAELVKEMKEVDDFVSSIEQTYVSKELPKESAGKRVPASFVRDVYDTTGCVVILKSGLVWGPSQEALQQAVEKVKNFLKSQTVTQLDIAQAHGRDVSHARMLARYFAAAGTIDKILESVGKDKLSISEEPSISAQSVIYTFSGDEKAVSRAKVLLKNAVNSRSPSSICVIRGMRHACVRKLAESSLKSLQKPVVGFIGQSDELYLEYQEPEEDFAASDEEIKTIVEKARIELSPLTDLAASLARKKVVLNETDIQFALKPRGPEATELWNTVIGSSDTVEVEESSEPADESSEPHKKAVLIVSGAKDSINEAVEAIPKIVTLSRHHLVKSSHVEEFNVDAQLVRKIIGRNGSQIQKFRETFDTSIDVDENGHVRVKGVEAQAKACAKEIFEFHKRLRDEVTEVLQIPSAFHAKLIGPRGKYVRRLSEKYNCYIKFPRSRSDSAEPADSASVVTSTDDGEDTITIRGPSRGVSAVKHEFLDFVNYEKAQSHSAETSVPAAVVSRLVGRGGVGINSIRKDTGAQIDIENAEDGRQEVRIVVKGERSAVENAIKQIRASADAALDHAEKTLDISPRFYRFITGPQNSKRRELVAQAGGDPEDAGRLLSLPPQNGRRGASASGSTISTGTGVVRLSGPSRVVEKLESLVLDIVSNAERQSQVQKSLQVPRNRLRRLIGVEGAKIKETEEKFNVIIEVPRGQGPENELVEISLSGETDQKVDTALNYLKELSLPASVTASLPQAAATAKLIKKISSDFQVNVTFASSGSAVSSLQQSPSKPSESNFVTETSPTVELIIACKSNEDGAKVVEHLKKYSSYNTTGYLWLPASQIKSVIGAGGKTINKIRSDTNCLIEVPQFAREAPVVIVGSLENVEAAKTCLLEASAK